MLMAWLRALLKPLIRRVRAQNFRRKLQTVATPNCPRCNDPMHRIGTIPNIYGVHGPKLLFRCDACGEWMEIRGWPT
jgi:hypothetical protein